MRTPAQIAGHPIHPMLVTIPIGLWIFSLVCDLIAMRSGAPATWATASMYAMVGGILGALAAALPGLVDLLSLRKTPVLPTAVKHMALNLTIVALYVANAYLRRNSHDEAASGVPLLLSVVAILLLLVSGWLGGKMVYEAGVGVHAEDMATSAAGERWSSARASAPRTASGARRDHAVAAGEGRPARDMPRQDRPSAGSSIDSSRE
jgi:uncharacterized membrane protein